MKILNESAGAPAFRVLCERLGSESRVSYLARVLINLGPTGIFQFRCRLRIRQWRELLLTIPDRPCYIHKVPRVHPGLPVRGVVTAFRRAMTRFNR